MNPTHEEKNLAKEKIEQIFHIKLDKIEKFHQNNLHQLQEIIILLIRNKKTEPILENIIAQFNSVVRPNWKSGYGSLFNGISIWNGVIARNNQPYNVLAKILYEKKYKKLTETEKENCIDVGILIKELFYSYITLQDYIDSDYIPRLELSFEVIRKLNHF